MKKVLLIAAVAVLALSSCQKERTCTCTAADGTTTSEVFPKASKKDQNTACDTYSALYVLAGGSCELD